MLRSLQLNNFRGFAEHRVEFGPQTILIGRNNAGKTTTIEALRILSVCQARVHTAIFIPRPEWLADHCEGAGFRTSLETIDFDFTNVQHAYDTTAPAIIRAKLNNNNEIHIYIGKGSEQVFCQLRKGKTNIIHSREDIKSKIFGITKVMPPVGSLVVGEKLIAKQRLKRYLDGYLAYRHFRNQLWERPPDYRLFKDFLEKTWLNLQIQHFENDHGNERNEFSLLIREGRFASEISWHGHGLQAWAQTIWFLARVPKDATIVLDEPDVYLHADLQRKLIKVIESLNFRQSMIATHSSEIISDVPFKNVVLVQKKEKVSKAAANASEIQASLRGMGSIHSIQLSKLAERGVMLFVEGDDKVFLADVAFKMGVRIFDNFSGIAIQEIKGKGNWQQSIGAAVALRDASGGEIKATVLLDGDYMLDEERLEYEDKAKKDGLDIKIWRRKEIENYFVIPGAISRYVSRNTPNENEVSSADIELIISEIETLLKNDLVVNYTSSITQRNRRLEFKASYKRAESVIESKIEGGYRISDMICGKDMFSELSGRIQKLYGVSFNALAICKEAKLAEIPNELLDFISEICPK